MNNQRDWILDRNPDAEVTVHGEDVMSSITFLEAVKISDLILCCADKQEVRSYVNTIAVANRRSCVTASVFRQGFGGEIYAYIPGASGCFDCMNRAASEQGWNLEGSVDLIPEEKGKHLRLESSRFQGVRSFDRHSDDCDHPGTYCSRYSTYRV